jgi:hypothetical protein
VVGVKYRGKLGAHGNGVQLTGPIFTAGLLPVDGRPLKLELTSGQLQAKFTGWHSYQRPAVVSNQYGLGRGAVFAYDLVSTLMRRPSAAQDRMIQEALGWVTPAVPAVFAGLEYAVVRARIENVGSAVDLKATLTPPDGGTVLGTAPAATPDAAGRPVWSFMLDSGAVQDLYAGLRLPGASGSYTADLAVESTRNGVTSVYGTFSTSLTVEAADLAAQRTVSGLLALPVASNDKADRTHAVAHIQLARLRLAFSDYGGAIVDLVSASERLLKITSVDVSAYRVEVARLLKEAQARWAAAQP